MNNSNYLRKSLHLTTTLALAIAATLTIHSAFAESGNASEKGAAQLLPPAAAKPVSTLSKSDPMPCSKCTDVAVTLTSTEKGHIQTPVVSQRHLCQACANKPVTSGTGKAAHAEVKHTCGYSTNPNISCCVAQNTAKTVK